MSQTHEPPKRGSVLVVDDEVIVRRAVGRALGAAGYMTMLAESVAEARDVLARDGDTIDVVLTDLYLGEETGLDLLSHVRREWTDTPVVIMTARGAVASAVDALRGGAYDFIEKPFDPPEVLTSAVQRAQDLHALKRLTQSLAQRLEHGTRFAEMVGETASWRQLQNRVAAIAHSDAPVLIHGETGTGKELVARAVHSASGRASQPMVTINCGALTETLLESELFGHARGAFTGANSTRRGLFEEANGGTVFLDEIGEMPASMQVKLLRVLQEGEVRRVGENRAHHVDVRVIAATHRDLSLQVASGAFREDLYYRINVVSLDVPPLRERRDDIPLLALHFARLHGGDHARFTPEALEALLRHPWPGNVRELQNVVRRGLALNPEGVIGAEVFRMATPVAGASGSVRSDAAPKPLGPLKEAKQRLEREYLERLAASVDTWAEAARIAGLDPSNLRRLYRRHELLGPRSE